MNILIIDDERLARMICINYLQESASEHIIFEAENTEIGESILKRESIDVIILDIEMPQETGIEFVQRVKPECHIIFATAYNEHAIKAFEINAIDYLLKPFDKQRFLNALEKVQRHDHQALNGMFDSLSDFLDSKKYLDRIMIKDRDRIHIVKTDDIYAIEAKGDYSEIITAKKSYLHHISLNTLEDRLDPTKFVRIHRSTIINMDDIAEISLVSSQKMIAIMSNGKEYDISRNGQQRIKELSQ